MRRFIVEREKDNVEVMILPCKKDGKFSFVNITKEHICSCKFDTVEEAIADMDEQIKQGKVKQYTEVF